MLSLSEILIQEYQLDSFSELKKIIRQRVQANNSIFLSFDVRPPFADTPEDWQDQLESVFTDQTPT